MFFLLFQDNNFKNLPQNGEESERLTEYLWYLTQPIVKILSQKEKALVCALVSIYFQPFAILFHFQGAPAPY